MAFFELTTPLQLFRKMEADLAALQQSGQDSHIAFNFFVTAEHLPDWLGLRALVHQHALLRIVRHLANGAKHFNVDPKRHRSVVVTSKDRYFEEGYIEPGYMEEPLLVHLSPDEADEMGTAVIDSVSLGRKVLAFWRPHVPGA
jgi:hypothetical protein